MQMIVVLRMLWPVAMSAFVYPVIETKFQKSVRIQSGIDCMRCSQTVFDSLPVFTGNKGAVDVGFDGMRFSG